jgi:hypothetical protein
MSRLAWNSFRNDVLDSLCVMPDPPSDLTGQLLRLHRDPAVDVIGRDYVLQHLPEHLANLQRHGRLGDDDVAVVSDAIRQALAAPENTLGGTALLSWQRLTRSLPDRFSASELAARAEALAMNESTDDLTRITAFQIAAESGRRSVAVAARRVLDGAASAGLKMSAAAALGQVGDSSDAARLTTLASTTRDPYLRTAASHAATTLQAR